MTENTDINPNGLGTLFYDGTCRICSKWARRVDRMFEHQGLVVSPFESGADEDEMRLCLNDGREFGGADAAWVLSGKIWWGSPIWLFGCLPGGLPMMRMIYRRIAAGRNCSNGACEIQPATTAVHPISRKQWRVCLYAFFIMLFAWWAGKEAPNWILMWMMAAAQYLAFKVLALSQVKGGGWRNRMVFILLWPGMDAKTFLAVNGVVKHGGWAEGGFFILIGVTLLWGVSGSVVNPILAGWCGMTGLIALLHFGIFTWLAKFWQSQGYGARPIMEAPWLTTSLAEFWGRRWNRAFSDVTRIRVFRPLSRRWGVTAGLIGGFVFSGLAHELVITVPAGAGYGLPTLYFLIQAGGVMIEKWIGLRGMIAKLWVMAVVLGPAYWLFSPVFLERVIVPFLEVIGN